MVVVAAVMGVVVYVAVVRVVVVRVISKFKLFSSNSYTLASIT